MGLLSVLLLVVFAISAVLLVVLVLLQDEQGEGLGGIFGGGGSGQIGNRKGNILTRVTSILGFVFILSSLGLAWLNRTPDLGDVEAAARRQDTEQAVEWWNESGQTDSDQSSSAE